MRPARSGRPGLVDDSIRDARPFAGHGPAARPSEPGEDADDANPTRMPPTRPARPRRSRQRTSQSGISMGRRPAAARACPDRRRSSPRRSPARARPERARPRRRAGSPRARHDPPLRDGEQRPPGRLEPTARPDTGARPRRRQAAQMRPRRSPWPRRIATLASIAAVVIVAVVRCRASARGRASAAGEALPRPGAPARRPSSVNLAGAAQPGAVAISPACGDARRTRPKAAITLSRGPRPRQYEVRAARPGVDHASGLRRQRPPAPDRRRRLD